MTLNITDFIKNGQNAIQTAINSCDASGGTIIIPKGEWITGSIHMKNNIHLLLEEGAVLRFSDNFQDYLPGVFTRWEGVECYNYSPLIYARNCCDISITGKGTLIGNGQAWWHWKQLQQEAANELCYAESNGIPAEKRKYGTEKAALRPSFIQTVFCKNVLLEDFTIMDGPQWTIHPVYSEDIIIRNVSVFTHGPNTDGLNPDSCKNVLIENCRFETGDDCIAINSGLNEDGWRVNRPCENITIRNCAMYNGHGGIAIGSAMSGGVRNVRVTGCKISGTMQGIRLKSMRGRGGYVEDIYMEDMEINDVSNEAVQINMFYGFSTVIPKSTVPPVFRNIHIKNVYGSSAGTGIEIKGLPEQPLKDIFLEHIHLKSQQSIICSEIKGIYFHDVSVE